MTQSLNQITQREKELLCEACKFMIGAYQTEIDKLTDEYSDSILLTAYELSQGKYQTILSKLKGE